MCIIRTANDLNMKRLRASPTTDLNGLLPAALGRIAKGEM
jgi:hypothetical protein